MSEFLKSALKAKIEADLREIFELGFAVEIDGLAVTVSDLQQQLAVPALPVKAVAVERQASAPSTTAGRPCTDCGAVLGPRAKKEQCTKCNKKRYMAAYLEKYNRKKA